MDLYFQEHDISPEQRTSAPAQSSDDSPTLLQIASTLATLSSTTTPAERVHLQTYLTSLLTRLSTNPSSSTGTPPTSTAFLQALPTISASSTSGTCPVCTDDFHPSEHIARLPCAHLFHPDCVLPWLKRHSTCPVCRADLPTDDSAHEERKRRAIRERAVSQMRNQMFN